MQPDVLKSAGLAQLRQLQQYIKNYQLKDFCLLAQELLPASDGFDAGNIYAARAAVKLFSADDTLTDDLAQAKKLCADGSLFFDVFSDLQLLDPNGLIVFNPADGATARFLDSLGRSRDALQTLYSPLGSGMGKQVESEILYEMGRLQQSRQIAESLCQSFSQQGLFDRAMMAGYTLFRCCLASGDIDGTDTVMARMIAWAKDNPDSPCSSMYRTIRTWANLTTGWGGDAPRYHVTPSHTVFPALEDRMEAIQNGINRLGPTEEPFAEAARFLNPDVYVMRDFYMDIYNAMIKYKLGNPEHARNDFYHAYVIAKNSQFIMPMAEYGMQIIPLLEYVLSNNADGAYSKEWIEALILAAKDYEESLNRYRREQDVHLPSDSGFH